MKIIVLAVFALGAYFIWKILSSSKMRDQSDEIYQKQMDAIPKKVAIEKSAFMPKFIELLKSEYPEYSDEFSEVSMDQFYESTAIWRANYGPEIEEPWYTSTDITKPEHKDHIVSEAIPSLPGRFKALAESNFSEWYKKMYVIQRLAHEEMLRRLA